MTTARTLAARIGGLSLSSGANAMVYTAKARATFLSRFEAEVDPERVLPPAERARRAEAARKLYFTKLSLRSVKARRRRRETGP